jgi:hypothetical protein
MVSALLAVNPLRFMLGAVPEVSHHTLGGLEMSR